MDKVRQNPSVLQALLIFVSCLVFATLTLIAMPTHAWAGGIPALDDLIDAKVHTVSYYGDAHDVGSRAYRPQIYTTKISNAKSSKPKVASVKVIKEPQYTYSKNSMGEYVKKKTGKYIYALQVTLKKPGTTYISFKYKGKSYKVKYVVKKYASPVTSFKIGSKQYASQFKPARIGTDCIYGVHKYVKATKFSGKISIKAKKGWKVGNIFLQSRPSGQFQQSPIVKNNSKIKAACNVYEVTASLVNTKTGQIEYLTLMAKDTSTSTSGPVLKK